MKTIRLLLLIGYALAALSAGYWTLIAVERFTHAIQVAQERGTK